MSWNPAWTIGDPPPGPVRLWIQVFSDDGVLLGAAPAGLRGASWRWNNGRLCADYSPVRIVLDRRGRYATGLICAMSETAGVFRPLWPVSLGPPGELRAGDFITLTDGLIALTPELPGPHG